MGNQLIIPPSYYDAEYYAGTNGKSNYSMGYSWDVFGALFTLLAQFLRLQCPWAQTFLDVGCATGLLVRALRASGVAAWGVDGSPWVIKHADAAAQPFVTCQLLEQLDLGRRFDVVVCAETLEHCLPSQLEEILPRVRQHTGSVFLATIPTPDMPSRIAWEAAVREPSHVTLEPRAVWEEWFTAAGFVYGPWQQLAERLIQQQLLFVKMGWNVFLRGVA